MSISKLYGSISFTNGEVSTQSYTTLLINVSAKQILSISLLRDSSKIEFLGIYIGSNASELFKNSGFLGNSWNSVPLYGFIFNIYYLNILFTRINYLRFYSLFNKISSI